MNPQDEDFHQKVNRYINDSNQIFIDKIHLKLSSFIFWASHLEHSQKIAVIYDVNNLMMININQHSITIQIFSSSATINKGDIFIEHREDMIDEFVINKSTDIVSLIKHVKDNFSINIRYYSLRRVFDDEYHVDSYQISHKITRQLISSIKKCGLPLLEDYLNEKRFFCNTLKIGKHSNLSEINITMGHFAGRCDYEQTINLSLLSDLIHNIDSYKCNIISGAKTIKEDICTHIIKSSPNITIEYNIQGNDKGNIIISGWRFSFMFAVYTCEDYYKIGSIGYYETKLNALRGSGYSYIELEEWANMIGIPCDDNVYINIQEWIDNLTPQNYQIK